MITKESIKKLAVEFRTAEFPNIIREYLQHLFLNQLYRQEASNNLLFKGGTALRIIYASPRFSEDLDFSLFGFKQYQQKEVIENLFTTTLEQIEKVGIKADIGKKPGKTTDGYYADAYFRIYDYPAVSISINVSARKEKSIKGEVDSIINDFVPAYNVFHLPQEELINEKIFGALLGRFKPRDFYDLYFIMRKGLLTPNQKTRLNKERQKIIQGAQKINFASELSVFLPQDQQVILRDFKNNLIKELNRQLSGI